MDIRDELKKLSNLDKKYREVFIRASRVIEELELENKELLTVIQVMHERIMKEDD